VRFAGGQKVRVREQNIMHGHHEIIQIADEVTISFAYTAPRLLTE
jgi:hypothetical protein